MGSECPPLQPALLTARRERPQAVIPHDPTCRLVKEFTRAAGNSAQRAHSTARRGLTGNQAPMPRVIPKRNQTCRRHPRRGNKLSR